MTVQNIDLIDQTRNNPKEGVADNELNSSIQLPCWAEERQNTWGELLVVPEWEEDEKSTYRKKHGWHGSDLIHDKHSPIRVLDYFAQYGPGFNNFVRGGEGTKLTGIAHFTSRAESHAGYCHGGSMCSLLDDVIGWVSFLVTGVCMPWSGFTVQINTSLKKPIPVNSMLLVQATIKKIDRRKVYVVASVVDPDNNDDIHAEGDGLVILNRGVVIPDSL